VRAAAYEDLTAARESRRLELGLASDELALGYLQRWERIAVHRSAEDLLCQLMGRLPSARVRLVLIGGGSELENVKRRMAEDARVGDKVNFVGQVPHDEVPSYLAALDIALLPAHESFTSPLKVFEYMAAAKPVVAPALPNIMEIIKDGETGLLFPPGNVEAMASHVLRLIAAPEQRRVLGEAARSEVLAKYTWEANARRLTQIAEEVLDARRR
jgi:glycosyltransferase involved in cell wall biosynthesis